MTLRSSTSATPPITLAGGTVTADAPVISITETWNNVAVTFTGFKINITDTTSAAGSLLADFQVATVSKFSVTKGGAVTAVGNVTAAAFIVQSDSSVLGAGQLRLGTDTGLARKSSKIFEINSGSAGTFPGTAFSTGVQTVAQLPAAATAGAGARSFVSDATGTTFMSIVAGTGANKVPVVSDGTNWLIG